MWFRKLISAQKKEYKINHEKMKEAENDRVINHPRYRRMSYTATHKPYNRTNYGDLSPREQKHEGCTYYRTHGHCSNRIRIAVATQKRMVADLRVLVGADREECDGCGDFLRKGERIWQNR